jgi:hypothetical protein
MSTSTHQATKVSHTNRLGDAFKDPAATSHVADPATDVS